MPKGYIMQGMRTTLTVVAAAGLLGGCKTGPGRGNPDGNGAEIADLSAPAKPEDRYRIAVDNAPFFKFSPQQAAGADQKLKKDLRVDQVSRLAGYSKVKLPAGDVGFVDTSDLVHLTPKEIADEDAVHLAQQQAAAMAAMPLVDPNNLNNANIGNGGNYVPPAEAGRTEPLPVADPNPTATPPPSTMFRY